MDILQTVVPTQDQINVKVSPDGVIKAGLASPEEIIKVNVTAVGGPGPAGPEGPPGPVGPPGNSENAISYTHFQMAPESAWLIRHSLNFNPGGIVVQDAAGTTYEGEIEYPDSNTVLLTFRAEISGTAYLS